MAQRSFIVSLACVAALYLPAALPPGEETVRVLILGSPGTLSSAAPPGLRYADWLQTFLEPVLGAKLEVLDAGLKDGMVKAGREAARKHLQAKPQVIVLGFGLDDALQSPPEEFRREYEGLLDDLQREAPASKVLLVTPFPLDARHPLAQEARFREAGGIDRHLKASFVEPLRALARERSLALADHHGLIEEALRAGERIEDLVEPEGRPTARGSLLAGRSAALSILYLLGARTEPPSPREALRGDDLLPGAPPVDLTAVLSIWVRDLEPLWLSRFKDEDPQFRLGALKKLMEAGTPPANFLEALLAFLEPAGGARDREQQVEQMLQGAVGSGLLSPGEAASALVRLIRKSGPGSFTAAAAFPMLERLAQPRPPGPQPGRAAAPARGPLRWTEEDLAFFAGALTSREQAIRHSATGLLASAGEPGVLRVLAEAKSLPEVQAVEVLSHLWQWRRSELPSLQAGFLQMSRGDPREGVRALCLDLVLSLPAQEIPLDLLWDLLSRESGTLLLKAAQLLAARGAEGLPLLITALMAEEEDRVQLSRTALLYLGLYSQSEEVARKALAALLNHFTPARQKELLESLEATLARTTPPLACLPAPVEVRIPRIAPAPPRSVGRRPVRTAAAAPRQVQPGSWPVESREPHVERLQDWLPRLEKSLLEGTDEEKDAAERLLEHLLQKARELDARPAAGRAAPLTERLQREASESLKRGDAAAFLKKARQAIAAGLNPGAINSFAWTLATTTREDLRDPREAERWAREAIDQGGRAPPHLETLAAALAGQGKFKEALEAELEALQNLTDENPAPFAARAILYQSKRAYLERPGKKKDP